MWIKCIISNYIPGLYPDCPMLTQHTICSLLTRGLSLPCIGCGHGQDYNNLLYARNLGELTLLVLREGDKNTQRGVPQIAAKGRKTLTPPENS